MPCFVKENLIGFTFAESTLIKAIDLGQNFVTAYRARLSNNPRPESVAIEGQNFNAEMLLNDLRIHSGIDTALGLAGPNSGMSVRL